MYKQAADTDKELEMLNAPAENASPFGNSMEDNTLLMGDAEMQEQFRIMQ